MEQASLIIGDGNWAVKSGSLLGYTMFNEQFYPQDIATSRATTATRVDENGLIVTSSVDIARIDYSTGEAALLVEPQRTNLLLNSQFNGAISGTPGTSPTSYINIQNTGILTVLTNPIGSKLGFITNGSNARAIQQSVSILSNTTYVYSLKAEVLTQNIFLQYMQVGLPSGATAQFVYNGTNVASNFLIPIGECNLQIIITNVNAGSLILRLGSGISGNTNGNIIIKEPQLTAGAYPTSYIPTTSASVTRNADVIEKTGISSLIGQTEGVLFVEMSALSNIGFGRVISLSDGTTQNRITIEYYSLSDYIISRVTSANVQESFMIATPFSQNVNRKIAVRYKLNDCAMFIDGVKVVIDTSVNMPISLNSVRFDDGSGSSKFEGKIKQLQVLKTALSDEELIQLTTL